MKAKISIIVPIYGVEEYLPQCINSILAQTYKNLQIILVDDGSKDNSGKICDEYAATDSRIEVIHQANGGLVSARKSGLCVADGDYVGFVDGDDYIETVMYAKMLEGAVSSEADVYHAGYRKNEEEEVRGTGDAEEIILDDSNRSEIIRRLIFDLDKGQIMSPCLCFKLFKRDIIRKAYSYVPDNQSYGEDLLALTKCIYLSDKIVVSREGYYHYRVRSDSIMNKVGKNALLRGNGLRQCMEDILRDEGGYEYLKEAIDTYWLTGIIDDLKKILFDGIRVFNCNFIDKLKDKRIVLYGAGAVGKDYYAQMRLYKNIDITKWVDRNFQEAECEYCDINSPNDILDVGFDYIVVAILNPNLADDIASALEASGISKDKILWEKPVLSSVMG